MVEALIRTNVTVRLIEIEYPMTGDITRAIGRALKAGAYYRFLSTTYVGLESPDEQQMVIYWLAVSENYAETFLKDVLANG